ncbi:hypothetical protein FGG08_006852 [Glutinoglossum americanum]|uniref:Septin-type G domain-containing protein n=1 Tax=Glutinoglossum americanum TaxID=1670608 RepID=A0A9P8KUJ3_9PEZI|nr:hypothetical protein FGG08_006852 [Glutinoglossum americanum]
MVSSTPPRPTTPAKSPSPHEKLPSIPENNGKGSQNPRRTSLGFLRRSKSGEPLSSTRSSSGSRMSKKQQALHEQELLRQQRAVPQSPPRLPDLYNGAPPTPIRSFGGDAAHPDSGSRKTSPGYLTDNGNTVPIPPLPVSPACSRGEYVDPYARTESMTHRGRYSYASSAVSTINSPRRVRRRKDPTPFNILIIGTRSSGKTSFLNFLRSSLAPPARKKGAYRAQEEYDNPTSMSPPQSSAGQLHSGFSSQYLETEIDGERIGLTLWDSQGLERNIVDLQLREMSSFLESKFEETFTEEMKVVRAPGVQDTHVHCAFLVLDPVRLDANIAAATAAANGSANGANGHFLNPSRIIGGLDEDLDVQVLRTLQGKTTVLPVISKADTVTSAHMTYLKKMVWDSLKKANLDPLEALGLDDFEGSSGSNRSSRLDEKDEDDEDDEEDDAGSALKKTLRAAAAERAKIDNAAQTAAFEEGGLSEMPPKRSSTGSLRKRIAESQASVEDPEQTPYLPLSVISPDSFDPGVVGRKFPWGFADPYNVEHCDFVRLREAVFSEWRGELREASRELWYEGWRTSRLRKRRIP